MQCPCYHSWCWGEGGVSCGKTRRKPPNAPSHPVPPSATWPCWSPAPVLEKLRKSFAPRASTASSTGHVGGAGSPVWVRETRHRPTLRSTLRLLLRVRRAERSPSLAPKPAAPHTNLSWLLEVGRAMAQEIRRKALAHSFVVPSVGGGKRRAASLPLVLLTGLHKGRGTGLVPSSV